jgi:undecaprenyl-diphosphatase
LLGLVQGLTEFLPISSDGHLAVIGHVAGVHTPGVFVEVALHVATLGSILVVYGGRFWRLVIGVLRRQPDALRYAGLLIIGMIPAGLVGIFLEDLIARAFDSLWAAGIGFLVTGALLWSTRHRSPDGAPSSSGWHRRSRRCRVSRAPARRSRRDCGLVSVPCPRPSSAS